MDNGWVVFRELGSYLSKDGSDCQIFRIVGLVFQFEVDTWNNIMGMLFAYAGS
jgi:hypothetical protein